MHAINYLKSVKEVVDHSLKHLLGAGSHPVSVALLSIAPLEAVDKDECRLVRALVRGLELPAEEEVARVVDGLAVEAEPLGHRRVQEAEGDGDAVFGGQHLVDVGVGRLVVVGRVTPELELVVECHVQGVEQLFALSVVVPVGGL